MNPSTKNPDAWAWLPAVVIHGTLAAALGYGVIFVVPRFKRIFADFGMKLPWLTEAVLTISDWMVDYWYLLVLPCLVLLVVDGVISSWLYADVDRRWAYWLWFTLLAFLPVFAGLLGIMALVGPLVELMDGLSK